MTIISEDGRFEWDDGKNWLNQRKHDIAFEEIRDVYDDPCLLEFFDSTHSLYEDRYAGIGCLSGIVIVVIFTIRNDRFRIISARLAQQKEIERYNDRIKEIIG